MEETGEVFLDGRESGVEDDLVVPLDAVRQGRLAQVGASDVGDGARAVEEVRLGMKARAPGDEDAGVESAFRSFLEVEQSQEGVGFGDAEVVAREDADPASAVEEVFEVSLEKGDAAFEDEGGEEVGAFGLVEVALQVRKERVALAGDETG